MRPNKLTPGHNLMWESSRMMLPEHVRLIQQHQKTFHKKERPDIDEQQAEVLSQRLTDAKRYSRQVRLTLFHPYHDRFVVGEIRKFQQEDEQLQLDSGREWILLSDILNVEIL